MRLSWERLLGWLLCKLLRGRRDENPKKPRFCMFFTKNERPGGGGAAAAAGSCWGGFYFPVAYRHREKISPFFYPAGRCSWEAQLGGSLLGGSFLGDAPVMSSWEAPCWEAPS